MFTAPLRVRVGLSEGEAQRKGVSVRIAKLPTSNVLRTEAADVTQGFMKVLVGANNDRILGFTMIASEAGEVMAAIQTAMLAELPCTKLRDAAISHLTIAEGLGPFSVTFRHGLSHRTSRHKETGCCPTYGPEHPKWRT
ncbi:hypothetical protein [Mesorhizobium sp. B2-3-5]|uniref:hypothetical protein n=1 Tax=Mesorhizobium sp. B2-3-5 TaxID=2589958 RepID=UPI00112C89C1|nr:hypothetical protein [Mesorhizobium sp. B2-3-5]TPM26903.1 hypothetical protein FJ958_18800 [Mesorhizobium sp. B2-3-5]